MSLSETAKGAARWARHRWLFLGTVAMLGGYEAYGHATRGFQADSELLVTYSSTMATRASEGVYAMGGHMWLPEGSRGGVYFSQWALQFKVIASLARLWPGDLSLFFTFSRFALCALTVAVLMSVVWFVRKDMGSVVAAVLWGLLLVSTPLIEFAPNLYWTLPLMLLPSALGWCAYGRMRRRGRWGLFLLLLGAAVLLKSLCGFEYLTTITLGALVPIVFVELSNGSPVRETVIRCLQAFGAQVLGFAVAFAMTVQQAAAFTGSWANGLQKSTAAASYRSFGDVLGAPISLSADLTTYVLHLLVEPQPLIFAVAVACLVALSMRATVVDSPEARHVSSTWQRVMTIALIASLSWNTLMWGHMRYHLHINFVTYYLGFNIAAFILLGVVLDTLSRVPGTRGAGRGDP